MEHEAGAGFEELIERVTERVREEADPIEGSLVEPKKASVALHYRLVADADRPAIKPIVDRVLAEHPGELKVTPGKMVYEIQPKLEWDKGKAVLYLLTALGLDGDDVVPSIWVTTSPTRTPSGRSPARASASSSARPTIRRSGAAAHPPRSCWTRSRRWNDFWTRWPGERRARRRGGRRLRQLRARRGGPARGADLHRQRLLLHARRGRVGGRGWRPLPGDVRARRLQPRDDA